MANKRWPENDPLTTFDNFSMPITDMNEGIGGTDKQAGVPQFKKMIEHSVLNGATLPTCRSFNDPEYLKPSYWNFANISNTENKPDNLAEHQVGFAHLEVVAGTDEAQTMGAKNYVVQKLTYVDMTDNTIRENFRGILLTDEGAFSNTTGWHCSTDSSDIAKSLTRGATMNGELVAGQDWVLARVSEVNAYIIKTNNKIIGRNLVEVLNATSVKDCFQKIVAMGTDYSRLMIGDYIDIPEIVVDGIGTLKNTSGNLRVEIAGFDHYYNVGDTPTGRGVLWVFRNCAFTHGMNDTNTNENGYNGSKLRTILNGAFATGLQNAIGVPLKEVHRLAEKHSSTSWWTNWVAEKCFLPTEVEVWGHQIWGNAGYSTGTSMQYPIFAIDPNHRMKNYNGSRYWWWTGTSCVKGDNEQPSTARFCHVSSDGRAGYNTASYGGGVSPAFYI